VAAAAQTDLKRVFAYSSVNHLGYCLLGIFALAVPAAGAAAQASQAAALNGVILQMFNHGITAAALFWFVAMLQERTGGHRGIDQFGGIRKPAPVLAGLMGIVLFSSLGLPGLNGFVGEFLIFRGVFSAGLGRRHGFYPWPAGYRGRHPHRHSESIHRPRARALRRLSDLHHGERLAMAPVISLMLIIGLVPQIIVNSVNPTVVNLLAHWRF